MIKIKENHCQTCKTTENLHIRGRSIRKDGTITHRFLCTVCRKAEISKYVEYQKGLKLREGFTVIDRNYCTRCKTTDNLMKSMYRVDTDGNKIQHYACRTCASARRRAYYHNGNQQKLSLINKRYEIKKRLLKMKNK